MKSNYKALSELIEKVDERNADGAITELKGVTVWVQILLKVNFANP